MYYYPIIKVYIITGLEVVYIMATNKLSSFSNDIFCKYRNGISASKLAKEYNVSTTTMTTFLKQNGLAQERKRGVSKEGMEDRKKAVELFNNGVHPSEILRQLNRSKSWFYTVAKSENLNLRGADHYTMSKATKIILSQSKQQNAIMWPAEQAVYDMLIQNGLDVIPQYSIGIKNIDFVIPSCSIAIELFCRGTLAAYSGSNYITDRIKELGNLGWHVYCLFSRDAKTVIADGIDDMLAWIDFIKRQPASRRQYRVFRRTSELLSCGCCDSD